MFWNKYYDQWWAEFEDRRKYPHFVLHYDLCIAKDRWTSFQHIKKPGPRKTLPFSYLVGEDYYSNMRYWDWLFYYQTGKNKYGRWVTPKAFDIIQLLTSPHYKTLLAIYLQRKQDGNHS